MCDQREDKRLDERGDAELSGLATDKTRGDPLFTAFHEPVEYRLLRAVHDEGDQFAPLVDDLQVFDEPLNMEEVVSGSRDDLLQTL